MVGQAVCFHSAEVLILHLFLWFKKLVSIQGLGSLIEFSNLHQNLSCLKFNFIK